MQPTNDSCVLFVVVMYCGITICSGHYTVSVKVSDLNSLELDKNFGVDQMCEVGNREPPDKKETRGAVESYDNEEALVRAGEIYSQVKL